VQVCGIGGPELLILALLAFVIVGPERTRQVAVGAGRLLGKMMRSEWWAEFNQMAHALRNLPATLVHLAELEETQAQLQRSLEDIRDQIDLGAAPDKPKPARREAVDDPQGIANATAQTWIRDRDGPIPPPDEPSEP
jgi:Sec-independent protein translocase protein TatA